MRQTGTVKRFNKIKGYGFLTADNHNDENNPEIFVHFSEVQTEGYKELNAGDRVSYILSQGEKGEFATQVQRID